MKNVRFLRALAVIALVAFLPALLFGQAVNFAQIQGRVTDPAGAAVSGAKVKATQTETGLVREVTTNNEGNYILPRLPVGPYLLQVSASGFKEELQSGIVLQVNEQPTINIALTLGAVSEKVEVSAAAALVETNDNSVSEVIDNSRILDLPLDGRQASQLVLLSGAANNVSLSGQDLSGSKSYGNGIYQTGTVTISVAGSQENANNYLLDGGDNLDAFSNINLPFPFPDAIQEFSVQESMLSAQYGLHAGAVVNVVTKSGTNNIHGDLFEFIRNGDTNALPFAFTSTPTADTLKRNQFGGTIGGPIVKDKLFAFLGYQGTFERSLNNPTTAYIPTAAELAGNWTAREQNQPGCNNLVSSTSKFKDPLPGGPAFTGTGANAWQVPTNLYNPASVALVNTYLSGLQTTTGCGTVSYQIPNNYDEHQGVAKVDWNKSANQTMFLRYFIANFENPQVFDPTNILTTTTPGQDTRSQSGAFGDTYTFSSGIVNSVHLTATRLRINRGPSGSMINAPDLCAASSNPACTVNIPSPIANALVLSVGGNGFSVEGGSATPGYFDNNTFQGADDVNIMHGKHQFSFGLNAIRYQLNYLSTYQSNGQFTFSGGYSGDNMLDFLLGDVSKLIQSNNEKENWRQSYFGAYANDNIRVKPNFTLNAGLRWDPYLPASDTMHRGSSFILSDFENNVHSTVFPNAPAGLFYCGDSQTPCSYINSHMANFAPRVGMVWDPKGDGKSSLRSGYGIFYDNPEIFFMDRYADNAPFGAATTLTGGTGTSTINFSNPYAGTSIPAYPTPFPSGSNGFFPNFAYGSTPAVGGGGIFINVPQNMKPTTVQQWNLSYEKQLGANWLLSATYLGSHTTHIWVSYEGDPACPEFNNGVCSLGTGAKLPNYSSPGAPTSLGGTNFTSGAPSTSNTAYRQYLYLLNPSQGAYFANMTEANDGATADYNGLLLTAKHRFSQNFTLLSNFTWSHCISDGDFLGEAASGSRNLESSFVLTPNALTNERGNCGFDIRRILNTSLVITSPKYNGLTGKIVNNWQLAPLFGYRSGQWFQVTESVDNSLTNVVRDRPLVVGDPNQGTCTSGSGATAVTYQVGTVNCWFNTSAFQLQPTGTYGTATRNMLEGPRAFTLDTSLSRSFKIFENQSLMVRVDAFNIINHPNFGTPGATCGGTYSFTAGANNTCTGLGVITGTTTGMAGQPRAFQGALKYTF
jgi:hypothetical protein